MRYLFLFAFLGFGFKMYAATSSIDPNYLKLKVYKVAVSTSEFCTNPITILNVSDPEYTDFLGSPTLGKGFIPEATFPCVIVEMSSIIKYSPAETSDNSYCVDGVEYSNDVCRSGNTSTLIDGSTVTCADDDEETVGLYITTGSTWTTGDGQPFQAPTTAADPDYGVQLNTELVVGGNTNAKFVVSGTGKISENGTTCEMAPPTFDFQKQ